MLPLPSYRSRGRGDNATVVALLPVRRRRSSALPGQRRGAHDADGSSERSVRDHLEVQRRLGGSAALGAVGRRVRATIAEVFKNRPTDEKEESAAPLLPRSASAEEARAPEDHGVEQEERDAGGTEGFDTEDDYEAEALADNEEEGDTG